MKPKQEEYNLFNFPIDKLVLCDNIKQLNRNTYGDLHITSKLMINNKDTPYCINWDFLTMPSFTYYIEKEKDQTRPIFYGHPKIHPNWEDTNDNGECLKTESEH